MNLFVHTLGVGLFLYLFMFVFVYVNIHFISYLRRFVSVHFDIYVC